MVGVAQLVEHLVVVQDAAGSSPVTHPTNSCCSATTLCFALSRVGAEMGRLGLYTPILDLKSQGPGPVNHRAVPPCDRNEHRRLPDSLPAGPLT